MGVFAKRFYPLRWAATTFSSSHRQALESLNCFVKPLFFVSQFCDHFVQVHSDASAAGTKNKGPQHFVWYDRQTWLLGFEMGL